MAPTKQHADLAEIDDHACQIIKAHTREERTAAAITFEAAVLKMLGAMVRLLSLIVMELRKKKSEP